MRSLSPEWPIRDSVLNGRLKTQVAVKNEVKLKMTSPFYQA